MTKNAVQMLTSYIEALRPIIYIKDFDFKMIDRLIDQAGGKKVKYIEFNHGLGLLDFRNKNSMGLCSLEQFLKLTMDEGFDHETILILKDVHNDLSDPKIISLLKYIAENQMYNEHFHETVLIISDVVSIPKELKNYITLFEIPLPEIADISNIIYQFGKDMLLDIDENIADSLAFSFKGLNEFQIKQILNLAYQDGGCIDKEDKLLILKEKEQLIKKSGLLELINYTQKIDEIGGLENLKSWLRRKEKVFSNIDKAVKSGVDIPKGIMIVGMPGCGKSITAKATADLFKIPLVRLDVGRLLGKYVGESEENMRQALRLSEAISPCVLWIDEIEKAFSGIGPGGSGSEVTTRLFGQFLTWMQEKENMVFIVATANNIAQIPPEFLRKGRFDELFFVDFPSLEERKKILKLHLRKRLKRMRNRFSEIDIDLISKETKGFSGADLEAVVKESIETVFINEKEKITTEDLLKCVRKTNGIAVVLKDKIETMRKEIKKYNIKSASTENVMRD